MFLPVLALLFPLAAQAQTAPSLGGFRKTVTTEIELPDAKVAVDLSPARFSAVAPAWGDQFGAPAWAAEEPAPFVAARGDEPVSASSWRLATRAMVEAAGLVLKDGSVAECAWCKGYDQAVDARAVEATYREIAKRTRGQSWVALWVPSNDLVAAPGETGCLGRSGVAVGVVWYVLGPDCGRASSGQAPAD